MIKRELVIFLIVGISTVLVDFVSYRLLIEFQIMLVEIAKATGFLIGSLFAYFANRFYTFGRQSHTPGSGRRFSTLYVITLSTNVLINTLMLRLLADVTVAVQLAFLLATGASACLNFLGMKFFVFKQIPVPELQ
jgi:putative flippase GtrA